MVVRLGATSLMAVAGQPTDKGIDVKRLALIGASLVLVGGMASACGSSPEDADTDEFCDAFSAMSGVENEDEFDDKLGELEDVGTPEEIDGDAREGFEILLDKAEWDTDMDDADLDDDEIEKIQAFSTKAGEVCSDTSTEDMESDTPSDVPSEMPSDLEEDLEGLEEELDGTDTE